jgi:predicted SprT family Zn-dependent metalloprotease
MELKKAQALTHILMHRHGLLGHWKFRWQNKKVSLGTCSYHKKEIRLSKWYVELNNEAEVKDTILHEIAHALSYVRHGRKGIGHGKLWKDICGEIGAIPRACSKEKLNKPKNHYKYVDTCCGVTYRMHRLRKNATYFCPKCDERLFLTTNNKSLSLVA